MVEDASKATIAIHFDIHEPIDLVDISESFTALASLYKEFVIEHTEDKNKKITVDLRITSISNNCILVDVIAVITIAGSVITVVQGAWYAAKFIKWLSSAKEKSINAASKDSVTEPRDLFFEKHMKKLVKLTKIVAKKKDRNMSVKLKTRETHPDGSTREAELKISTNDAVQMKKGINNFNKRKAPQRMAMPKSTPSPLEEIISIDEGSISYKDDILSFSMDGVPYSIPYTKEQFNKLKEDIVK